MRPPTNVVSVSPGFSRSCLAVMTAQQPEPPLSQGLLLTDGAVVACYSISCSMVSLFQSEEYLEPPVITVQDVIDIAYALINVHNKIETREVREEDRNCHKPLGMAHIGSDRLFRKRDPA